MEPITRTCRTCGYLFTVTTDQVRHLEQLAAVHGEAVILPTHCDTCCDARRRLRQVPTEPGPDQTVTCAGCGRHFTFDRASRSRFAARRWPAPKRCATCRGSQ